MKERVERIGKSGEYALLFFPDRPFAYVWAWRPSINDGKIEWEQGHYFETIRQALDFKEPEILSEEETGWKMPYASRRDFVATSCKYCNDKCVHQDAYRRIPRCEGGLALCRNLA